MPKKQYHLRAHIEAILIGRKAKPEPPVEMALVQHALEILPGGRRSFIILMNQGVLTGLEIAAAV